MRPLLEEVEDRIDALEGEVLRQPLPALLERELIHTDLLPFLRDIHDPLARDLNTVARERDRLAGLLDLYQSSVANQNNEATRLLTVLGTLALPAIVISAFCGMSLRYPGWMLSGYTFAAVSVLIISITGAVLWALKRRGYFS